MTRNLAVIAESTGTILASSNLKAYLSARNMTFFQVTLPVCPSMNVYWKNWKGRTILSNEARAYREESQAILNETKFVPFGDKQVDVFLVAYFRDNRRRDIDNYIKPVLDILKGNVFEDDSQVCIVSGCKLRTTKEKSFMEVLVCEHRSKVEVHGPR